MKKTTLAAGTAIALTVLVGGAALAQNADRPERSLRADMDGDGRISRSEFVDGRIGRLNAIDADRNGSVSAEERLSGVETRRNQRISSRFETLDKDGNGSLSREEFTSEIGKRGQRGGRYGAGGHGAEMRAPVSIAEAQTRAATRFDRLDMDSDGFITVGERRAARETMREHRRARHAMGQPSPPATASE